MLYLRVASLSEIEMKDFQLLISLYVFNVYIQIQLQTDDIFKF